MKGIFLAVLSIATLSANIAEAASESADCRRNSQPTMQCFTVHGRLSLYNGTPGFRIWKVGSKRLFGVLNSYGKEPEDQVLLLPEPVQELMKPDTTTTMAYGDFTICPFTAERPGRMQMVCISDASNLIAKSGQTPETKR
jgi:hypothetical protein